MRLAYERGDLETTHGKGQPIAGIDDPADDLWWVKRKLRDEGITDLPPALAIIADRDQVLDGIPDLTDDAAREALAALNERIRHLNRTNASGPPTTLMPLDVELTLDGWRRDG